MQKCNMKRILFMSFSSFIFTFYPCRKNKASSLYFYTPQRIEQAKISVRQDTRMSEAWNSIRKTADNPIAENSIE